MSNSIYSTRLFFSFTISSSLFAVVCFSCTLFHSALYYYARLTKRQRRRWKMGHNVGQLPNETKFIAITEPDIACFYYCTELNASSKTISPNYRIIVITDLVGRWPRRLGLSTDSVVYEFFSRIQCYFRRLCCSIWTRILFGRPKM